MSCLCTNYLKCSYDDDDDDAKLQLQQHLLCLVRLLAFKLKVLYSAYIGAHFCFITFLVISNYHYHYHTIANEHLIQFTTTTATTTTTTTATSTTTHQTTTTIFPLSFHLRQNSIIVAAFYMSMSLRVLVCKYIANFQLQLHLY